MYAQSKPGGIYQDVVDCGTAIKTGQHLDARKPVNSLDYLLALERVPVHAIE
jgi:hypothetical protein